jgi:hypothetical protein
VPIEKTFHTPRPLRLAAAFAAGELEVESVDGEETTVVADAGKPDALEHLLVEVRDRGDGQELVIDAERRRGLFGGIVQVHLAGVAVGGADYRIQVRCPHGTAIALKTASADLRARGTFGGAEIKTTSGKVDLDVLRGDADVRSVSGDVSVHRVDGRLDARTVSGDLRVDGAGSDVTTKTVSGDQELVVEEGEIRTNSVSGDVEIGVRAGSRVDVDASSVSGHLHSELELGDAPSEGAGPVVVLRGKTVSGDFRVRRAPAESATAA